jgi:Damage-control phosphatase ARMT1-like domain
MSGTPGSFARGVMTGRHPALLEQIRAAYPYGAAELDRLDRLRAEIDGVVEPLAGWDSPFFGRSWLEVPFLWAESCFYHKLLRAVGYPDPGPWQGIDPFEFLKTPELASSTVDDDLAQLARLGDLPAGTRTGVLLPAALWGNRADLGFRIGRAAAGGETGDQAHLVADDTDAVVAALAQARRVVVLADNAGRELIADLVLAEHLTAAGTTVVLHVKPHPYYVSDATTADVVACLRRLAAGPPAAAGIAGRLHAASGSGRFTVATDPFWGGPSTFHALPPPLRDELGGFDLAIVKGDLNYRRLVGDCHWPATTPFADLAGHFPTAVAALRTLKSDVAAGIGPEVLRRLDASGEPWRTSGAYGLVQFTAPLQFTAPGRG